MDERSQPAKLLRRRLRAVVVDILAQHRRVTVRLEKRNWPRDRHGTMAEKLVDLELLLDELLGVVAGVVDVLKDAVLRDAEGDLAVRSRLCLEDVEFEPLSHGLDVGQARDGDKGPSEVHWGPGRVVS